MPIIGFNEPHPAVKQVLRWFRSDHLSYNTPLQETVRPFEQLANDLADKFTGPEVTVGLRKLLEAKDCFVRAHVEQQDNEKIVNS
jgi:hypothetical protein